VSDVRTGARGDGARRAAGVATLAIGAGLAGVVAALPFRGVLPALAALALFATVGAVARERITAHHRHGRLGAGNVLTLVRAAGAAALGAMALEPGLLGGGAAWGAAAGAALLLALDGLDGWAARRQGLASAFGARLDLEVDALLILVLAALATGLGKAGPWVLGLGLLRYAFVAAGWLVPALRRPLPPSRRRKAVCGLQVAVLGLLLAPPVGPPLSEVMAAGAFAALAWSFAVDVRWLVREAAR
jgi:phosphatidylglycerophosphate synthase